MKCFLTSSPFLPDRSSINPANGFADRAQSQRAVPVQGTFSSALTRIVTSRRTVFAQAVRANLEALGSAV